MSNLSRAPRGRHPVGLALLVVAFFLVAVGATRADLIFLKDGFVLQGKVKREGVTEIDPVTREAVFMPRGFFTLDDGPRRIVFSPTQVRVAERSPVLVEERFPRAAMSKLFNPGIMPPIADVVETGEWNQKWQREYWARTPNADKTGLVQQVTLITPYHVRVDAVTKFFWACAYLTKEFDPETIAKLLAMDPKLTETDPKLKPADIVARRMRKVDFFAQAGWFRYSERELSRIEKDYPAEKKRVAAARKSLATMQARERFEDMKRWQRGGRHQDVRDALADFPEKAAPENLLVDVREMRAKYKRIDAQLKDAAKYLTACAKETTEAKYARLVAAAAVIRSELHFENVGRLDAFLGQARQAERQKNKRFKPSYSAPELLSLAVTGWLLGSSSSEARPESAIALWQTRGLVLKYCQTDDPDTRKDSLRAIERLSPKVEIDEVAQLIPQLPPIEPETKLDTRTTPVMLGAGRRGTTYQLKLPPEYTHNRPYPVLIALHRSGEKAKAMIERFGDAAAENGYVLAAPAWEAGLGNGYTYTEDEHAHVLRTVADLRRRFRIDSDRVFLFGLEEGGKMAFDVGLAHPSLFAGVMPMSASATLFPDRYWRNAQYLPMYVVTGTRTGDTHKQVKARFEEWTLRGYPSLWIDYKNRGHEWFAGEVPFLFDWMNRQRRAFPLRQLGTDGLGGSFGNEFTSLREADNRFYWLTTSGTYARNTATAASWRASKINPAMVSARVDNEQNEINIKATGMRYLTVWLGRTPKGTYLLDLDKPLTVRVGFKNYVFRKRIAPSLKVLLDDLQARSDREHLFVAKIEIDLSK